MIAVFCKTTKKGEGREMWEALERSHKKPKQFR